MSSTENFVAARDLLLRHRNDYKHAYAKFRWPELGDFNWALDYFDAMARGNEATALWIVDTVAHEGRRFSFAQMAERSARLANFFRTLGVRRGDRILLMLGNQVELWDVMLASMKLGAVVLPASVQLSVADIADRIGIGAVQYVVVCGAEAHKFETIDAGVARISVGEPRDGWTDLTHGYAASADFVADAPTRATDPMLRYFTSGTASRPKLVEHTHQSYPVGHLSTMYWIGLLPGDVHWNISSPGWAKHAWSCFFAPWNACACVFVFNFPRFVPTDVLTLLVRCGVTSLCAPPTVWRMLVQETLAAYPVRLREIVGAGEPLNAEIIERVRQAWGLDIRDGFGQTETTCMIGNSPAQPLVPGSMGRPLPGYRVALIDADGRPTEEGEIALPLEARPLGLMTGYVDDGRAATGHATRDGYYHTSDIAIRRDDGYYVYVGRADDVFKSSDYRLSPFELESVLIEHEAIAEAAVVPSADALRLAVPKAFLAVRQGFDAGPRLAHSVFRFSREKLAPYKRIRRLQFSDLPKTISGKIRRAQLRQQELGRTGDPARLPGEYWEEDFPDLR